MMFINDVHVRQIKKQQAATSATSVLSQTMQQNLHPMLEGHSPYSVEYQSEQNLDESFDNSHTRISMRHQISAEMGCHCLEQKLQRPSRLTRRKSMGSYKHVLFISLLLSTMTTAQTAAGQELKAQSHKKRSSDQRELLRGGKVEESVEEYGDEENEWEDSTEGGGGDSSYEPDSSYGDYGGETADTSNAYGDYGAVTTHPANAYGDYGAYNPQGSSGGGKSQSEGYGNSSYDSYGGSSAPKGGESHADEWGASTKSHSFKQHFTVPSLEFRISIIPAIFLILFITLVGMMLTAYMFENYPEGTFANCCRVSLTTVKCMFGVAYNLYHCRLSEIPQVVFAADYEEEELTDQDLERMKLRPGIERALDVEHRKALRKVGIEMNKIKVGNNGAKKNKNSLAAGANKSQIV